MDFSKVFLLISTIVGINCATIDDRLDCVIENLYFHETECKQRDCIWSPVEGHEGTPWCYFDTTKIGYQVSNLVKSASGIEADLQLKQSAKNSIKFEQIENLKFTVSYLTENILRFKITDPKNKRYEVPVQQQFPLLLKSPVEKDESKRKYSVEILTETSKDFHFTINRKETKAKIWDTSIGGLIFTDQFLQIASYLPSKNIYGFGENTHQTLRHNLNYKTWPLFAMDLPPGDHDKNLYGVHPFYTCLENDGKSHGILFLNSNAMEYTLLPSPALSLKTTGGILDFFVFVGDNPEHVIQLYTSLIGRPVMPPFWGLGFQLTRYGYQSTEHVKKVIDRNVKEKIPMDIHYIDIDYMNNFEDFTYDHKNFAKLPELIDETKRDLNLKWTLILDPAIQANDTTYDTFTKGYQQNVFIKWPKDILVSERNNPPDTPNDKDVMYGRVWPRGPAAFPDFFQKMQPKNWWKDRVDHLYRNLSIRFDALWIDMNEPSNFDNDYNVCPNRPCYYLKCPNSKYDEISARIKPVWVHTGNKRLSLSTLCMTAVQGDSDQYRHYDVHNLYGWSETEPSESAIHSVTGKRGFVVTRSTYVSSNRHAAHWLGDNTAQWSHLRHSIIGMLEFSLFGFSWTGADICGFLGDSNPDLCKRWQQLGAFYPFSRNHNALGATDQDPAVWVEKGHPEVTEAARSSLNVRYILLHYLYTLFFRAHTLGETVARPLFHEYPKDSNTYDIDQQFLWGRSILISPLLFPDQKEVDAYIPNDVWYVPTTEFAKLYPTIGHVRIPDPKIQIPTHIRGGSILPIVVKPAVNTKIIRETPIQIEVYPKDKSAFGDMFWDDGESIGTIESGKYNYYEFNLHNNCSLEIKVIKHGYDSTNPQIVERVLVANTASGDIVAHIDGVAISSPVVKEDYISLPVNINLSSKKTGQKWVIDWKLKSSNKCNLN